MSNNPGIIGRTNPTIPRRINKAPKRVLEIVPKRPAPDFLFTKGRPKSPRSGLLRSVLAPAHRFIFSDHSKFQRIFSSAIPLKSLAESIPRCL